MQFVALGTPVITLPVPDAYSLGAEFFRWEYAISTACSILQVNAFDQPDVQDNKTRTKNKIAAYTSNGEFEEGLPIWANDDIKVFGQKAPGLKESTSLTELVKKFLSQGKTGDYVAINAYLPRNAATLTQLQSVRQKVLEQTGLATTLGFGPRFLHSTGQLHKGGSDQGIFLQITADPEKDLDIPSPGDHFWRTGKSAGFGRPRSASCQRS